MVNIFFMVPTVVAYLINNATPILYFTNFTFTFFQSLAAMTCTFIMANGKGVHWILDFPIMGVSLIMMMINFYVDLLTIVQYYYLNPDDRNVGQQFFMGTVEAGRAFLFSVLGIGMIIYSLLLLIFGI